MRACYCCCQKEVIKICMNVFKISSSVVNSISRCAYCTGVNIEADSNEHPGDNQCRTYVCLVCDIRFTRQGHFSAHLKLHSGEDLYTCSQCHKQFASYNNLRAHAVIHTNKHTCIECGKSFVRNNTLTIHRRTHLGVKPFECSVCGKRFTQFGNLATHIRIHSGEKP